MNNELNSDKNKLTNQITELTKQINNFKSNESKRIEEDLRLFKNYHLFAEWNKNIKRVFKA